MNLYPHQEKAADFLSVRRRAGLFDDMGLGKTAAAIVAADRAGAKRMLVCAPSVVAHNWAREIKRWSARDVQVITSGRQNASPTAKAVVVTHALLLNRKLLDQIVATDWDVVVLDEAHYFKNPKAKRTRAFYGMPGRYGLSGARVCVTDAARHVWVLTGTPMPNDPTELWTMLAGLAPERIRDDRGRMLSWRQFRDRYCELAANAFAPDGVKVVGVNQKTIGDLRERMRGFSIRRKKTDHLDLPPVRHGIVAITNPDVPKELAEMEAKLRRPSTAMHDLGIGGFLHGSKVIRPADVDAAMGYQTDLLEAMQNGKEFSTWRRLCGEAKAAPAADMLHDELEAGALDKVVVFAHHKQVVDVLAAKLQPFGVVRITGDVPPAARQTAVDQFQTDPSVRVAVCQIVAGGTGVTLTAACELVMVEQSFVPGENAQACDRVNRIGQTRPVNVRVFTLAGSVDELIAEALARKSYMIKETLR